MSRYNQYGYQFYDPVGSASHQATGYTHASSHAASAYSNTSTSSGYQYGGTAYNSQQYGGSASQQASNSASHAAAALSSLSNQNYHPPSSSGRNAWSGQSDNSTWYNPNSASNTYASSTPLRPDRDQSNNSILYANTQSESTFGRLSIPEQTQSSSNTYAPTTSYESASSGGTNSYHTAYTQPPNAPPRYNSLLQTVQAHRHGHSKQPSQGSSHKSSPRMAQAAHTSSQQTVGRQQSASVEPSPTTVDPSQVYDNRAELHRKAQVEAERRRKYEAEQAAKKAEEERIEAERRKAEEEKQKAEREAAKKAEQERKMKAREEKKQSKSAATALQKMASGGGGEASSPPPANSEEAEMRAMFQKMREFNAKNPAMLAKLWEEERNSHAQSQSPQPDTASKAPAQQAAASAASPTAAPPHGSGMRPFKKPAELSKAPKAASAAPQGAQQTASTPTQPATQQTNASLWPPHKMGALAEATAKWLRSQPQNSDKTFTSQTVLNVLDKNPSYVQLCESLEALDLKFERAALARELLRAVPDGLKAQPTGNSAAAGGATKTTNVARSETGLINPAPQTSSIVNYEAPLSLSNAAREVNTMDRQPSYQSPYPNQSAQSPYFAQPRPASRPSSQSQPPPEIKPAAPLKPPADKEEAARKRTFGDLVDLTAEESEDETTGPPTKKVFVPTSETVNGFHASPQPGAFGQAARNSFKQYLYNSAEQNDSRLTENSWQLPAPGQQQQPPNGVAPAVQPPVVPSQPQQKPKGPSAEHQQQVRMRGKMLVEPIMRDRVARKTRYDSRTIARDVLLATGRHPDMRGLNAHLVAMQKLLASHGGEFDSGGSKADLATVRWDIIDPDPPKEDDLEVKRPHTARSNEGSTVNPNPTDMNNENTTTKPAAPRPPSATATYEIPVSHNTGSGKKRGRPPKYTLSESKSTTSLTNGLGEGPRQTTTSSRPAKPSSAPTTTIVNTMSSNKPVGYSQFQHVAEDGTIVKKKGRPLGWRKNVHSREAQGLAPATLPSRRKENKGATATSSTVKQKITSSGEEEQQLQEPQYQVYKCKWSGCKAELHNLETLKKHLVKVHGSKTGDDGDGGGGVYECWWKGCGAQTGHEGKVKTFDSIEEWIQHVDRQHLSAVAWKLGDGPAAVRDFSSSAEQPPGYLFDEHGRSVTPVIKPTPPRTSSSKQQANPMETPADSTPPPPHGAQPVVQKLGRGRPPKDGISKAQRDLGAPLQELEEHQRGVGVVMDRMGCVLVDERRRNMFLDDEEFEDEVYESDHDDDDEE